MRAPRPHVKFPLIATTVLAAIALTTVWLPAAVADGGHAGHDSMPGMTADQHAQMPADTHGSMPGMTADRHAQMPGDGHGEPAAARKRPVWLLLGGFALINGLALAGAVVLRRRPASVKRRATLARVRRAAGTRTPSTSTDGSKS